MERVPAITVVSRAGVCRGRDSGGRGHPGRAGESRLGWAGGCQGAERTHRQVCRPRSSADHALERGKVSGSDYTPVQPHRECFSVTSRPGLTRFLAEGTQGPYGPAGRGGLPGDRPGCGGERPGQCMASASERAQADSLITWETSPRPQPRPAPTRPRRTQDGCTSRWWHHGE